MKDAAQAVSTEHIVFSYTVGHVRKYVYIHVQSLPICSVLTKQYPAVGQCSVDGYMNQRVRFEQAKNTFISGGSEQNNLIPGSGLETLKENLIK